MRPKILITDIDGCLTSEGSIPFHLDAFLELARLCRQANTGNGPIPPVTLCTGRPQPYVEALMKFLDIRLPAICENGAVIYTLHDNHARYGPGVTDEAIHALRAVRGYIEDELLPRHPGALIQFGKESQISVYCADPAVLPRFVEPVRAFNQRQGGPALEISPSHYYLNISIDGVNKGRAIRWLLEEMGLRPEDAAGIGDTVGDIPIRENVGFFGCPANAHDALKAVSHYIAREPELEGVLEIIRALPGG